MHHLRILSCLTLLIAYTSLAQAAPVRLDARRGGSPEGLNPKSRKDRLEIARQLAKVDTYLKGAPKGSLPEESRARLESVLKNWISKPKDNPFSYAVDPIFAQTAKSLPILWVNVSGGKAKATQVLSCSTTGAVRGALGVFRFFDPHTGEHRFFNSLAAGCNEKLKLEGRSFVTLPAGQSGTQALKICVKDGVRFVSVDAGCEGGTIVSQLGGVYPSPKAGLVPLYSATHEINKFTLVSTNLDEYSASPYYKNRKVLGYVIPSLMNPIVSVGRGHFQVNKGGTYYYSNGDGLYCTHRSPKAYVSLGGRTDNANLQNVDRMPAGMKGMGPCVVPTYSAGPLKIYRGMVGETTTEPGPILNIPWMNANGKYETMLYQLYYTNGANLVCSFNTVDDFKAMMPPIVNAPDLVPAVRRLDASLIYTGPCKLK